MEVTRLTLFAFSDESASEPETNKAIISAPSRGKKVIRDKIKTPDKPVVVPINPQIVDKINASIKN